MTPAAIYTAIRDALIGGALVYILWFIHTADQNAIKVKDLQGVQKQLTQNAKEVAAWAEQAQNAEAQRRTDMATVTAAIAEQRAPVFVRVPSGPSTVPSTPAKAPSGTPSPVANDQGAGSDTGTLVNVRDKLNAWELKNEGYLAGCRALRDSWP